MYFKKLELVGFKSFMEKTTLHFEPGVTAIVGPNGCGKSNIFDSIRWVLGEQSVKSLRGSQMEDVIFNGTDSKPALSMAEVSLSFDNGNKFFPVDHDEVTVTRRIFRSGESEYLLNKSVVRLKDILELLMGTGIGAESYSLVAQGKIDLILSSRPEDRRMVFDEASGITKYKAQKREALRKLEETEQNLLRVNDIIAEVKRSIGYLERQANKARRYKDAFELLKSKEIILAVFQKQAIVIERTELSAQLEILKGKEEEFQQRIKEYEISIAEHTQELQSREESIASIKNNILTLENNISKDAQHVNFNQEWMKELESTKENLQAQIDQISVRLQKDEEKLLRLKEEEDLIQKNIEEKTLLLREKEHQLNGIIESSRQSTETIALAKKNILDIAATLSQVKNEAAESASKKQILLARKKRLEVEKAKTYEERVVIEDNLSHLDEELKEIQERLKALNQSVAERESAFDSEQSALNQVSGESEQLERQKMALESHREFLEKLKTQYESIGTSMNAVIYLDQLPTEKINGLVVKVKGNLEIGEEDRITNTNVHLKLQGEAKPIDLDAQNVEEKLRQIEERLVSLREVKRAKEASIEELRLSLASFRQQCQEQEIALGNRSTSYQSVLEQCNKIKDEEEVIASELSDLAGELVSLDERLISLEARSLDFESELKAQEALIHGEQERVTKNSALKEEIMVILASARTELESQMKRLNSEDNTLRILEETYRQNKENLHNLSKQIEEGNAKFQSLSDEITSLSAHINLATGEIKGHQTRLKEEETSFQEMASGVNTIKQNIESARKESESLKDKVYIFQMKEKDADFKYQSIRERMLQAYKIDIDTYVKEESREAVTLTEPQSGQPVSPSSEGEPGLAAAALSGEQPQEAAVDIVLIEQEIETLKEKINSYGTVNLVAIEEYDELKKRYDFLTQQHTDLVTAKESLQDAIRKINATTRKMFVETFEKVAEEFRNYFRLLFNGGDAKVYLLDEQDPLESGIEIICRPPGKKLQNVLLLSGGEKSLSAIALIFAIFKIKPAPFCVLDEIDAALDEANVDRLGRIFQEFTGTSQFIIITHNKKTIANADVMYGITMAESGVSKIVSVKFAERQLKEKVPAEVPVAA